MLQGSNSQHTTINWTYEAGPLVLKRAVIFSGIAACLPAIGGPGQGGLTRGSRCRPKAVTHASVRKLPTGFGLRRAIAALTGEPTFPMAPIFSGLPESGVFGGCPVESQVIRLLDKAGFLTNLVTCTLPT